MASIPEALQQIVRNRANRRCEYCRSHEIVRGELEIDHILPESRGGETESENLCLACRQCNLYKSMFQTGKDPVTSAEVTLFHPRQQQWQEHFQWSADGLYINGITPVGRATVERLRMNRPQMVEARSVWRTIPGDFHPPR